MRGRADVKVDEEDEQNGEDLNSTDITDRTDNLENPPSPDDSNGFDDLDNPRVRLDIYSGYRTLHISALIEPRPPDTT